MSSSIELVMLVTALCADAFAASFLYGTDQVKIPPLSVLIIAALSAVFLSASLLLGNAASALFPPRLASVLGFLILFFLGLAKLFDSTLKSAILKSRSARKNLRFSVSGLHFILTVYANPQEANQEDQAVLSPAEALSVGLAMSLDSLAAGLGAGFTDGALIPAFLLALILGAVSVRLGCVLGSLLSRRIAPDLSWLSGAMLILLAIIKLF